MLTLAQAKYVFYFIGDGMGPNQVLAAEMYQAELEGRIGRVPLLMTQFPVVGMTPTFSLSNAITDSSAAGTCLASDKKPTMA
jgi:alkaline phosphatase